VVLEVEADDLGAALKWEPSRGGDLFPHLYGRWRSPTCCAVHEAPLGADGVPADAAHERPPRPGHPALRALDPEDAHTAAIAA
jgi:hypothetical protein